MASLKKLNEEKEIFVIKLRYTHAPILEALGKVTYPYHMSKISRITGIQEHACRLRIQQLMEQGWRFTVYVDESKLRLKRLIIILKRKPKDIVLHFLRLMGRTLPDAKYLLSYYLPVMYEPEDLVKYYYDYVEDYYVIDTFDRTRPDGILRYYDKTNEEIRVSYYELLKVLVDSYDSSSIVEPYTFKSSFSSVDLVLIKELQKNPFMTYKELSEKTGLSYARILRRMKSLSREGIIGSMRIMKIPGEYNLSSTIFIRGMPPYRDMIDKLLSLPYVSGVGYTSKLIAISLRLSWKAISVLGDIVEALSGKYEVKLYLIDPKVKRAYTIPYLQEYSKYKAEWIMKSRHGANRLY